MTKGNNALLAELLLAGVLLGYGWFSTYRLVLLLLLASMSLWTRGFGWRDLGLSRPAVGPTVLQATGGALVIFAAVRLVIVPLAVMITGVPVDLSSIEAIRGNPSQLWLVLATYKEVVLPALLAAFVVTVLLLRVALFVRD